MEDIVSFLDILVLNFANSYICFPAVEMRTFEEKSQFNIISF